jgi:hypothetical protein
VRYWEVCNGNGWRANNEDSDSRCNINPKNPIFQDKNNDAFSMMLSFLFMTFFDCA